jgi:uncharacterized protein (DUF2249 family)
MSVVASPIRTIDIRSLGPCTDRKAAVVAAFDALAPGESLGVVNDHRPRGLLVHLQEERPGLFDWSVLEDGPEVFRVEIVRRGAERGALREVMEALAWDHDRLDALERRAFAERAAGRPEAAASTWRVFATGLRRHIGFEDALLFPEFEARTGITPNRGPTAVMRLEHRRIESLVQRIGEAIADPGPAADLLRQELHELLSGHNVKEEQVLYPGTDRLMSPEERDALVRRIQAY